MIKTSALKKIRLDSDSMSVFLSILPLTLFILLVLIYPLCSAFFHSFTKWTIKETVFIGLENYNKLISGGSLFELLKNNLIVLLAIPIQISISLVIAYLLYSEVWGWKLFRVLFYIPAILSVVVIGYLFRVFFSLNGPLNILLRTLNLDFLVVDWFSSGATSFVVVIIALIWSQYGVAVLIFLTGMSAIDPAILDSAIVDGANWWKRFIYIVLPMIIGTIEFYLVVLVIGFFTAVFGFIYSITYGGPGYSTTTIEYMVYIKAFKANSLGQASALAIILFLIVLVLTVTILRVFRKFGAWQE